MSRHVSFPQFYFLYFFFHSGPLIIRSFNRRLIRFSDLSFIDNSPAAFLRNFRPALPEEGNTGKIGEDLRVEIVRGTCWFFNIYQRTRAAPSGGTIVTHDHPRADRRFQKTRTESCRGSPLVPSGLFLPERFQCRDNTVETANVTMEQNKSDSEFLRLVTSVSTSENIRICIGADSFEERTRTRPTRRSK